MALREELQKQGDFLFRYRSNLPLILIIFGIGLKVYQDVMAVQAGDELSQNIPVLFSLSVGLLGLFVRIITVGYTPRNTSGRNTSQGQVADKLNTTGIYSLIRNPLYLGNYLMWVSVALLTDNLWFTALFSLVFWIYYERIVYSEEAFLRVKFGDTYLKWAEKTPPFLPKFFSYKSNIISFSWKKILKKEKNGLFALFLLFWIFQVIGDSIKHQDFTIEYNWQLYSTIATAVIYLLIRSIRKNTKLLNETDR
ncbi:isoprenylcysteine carboxylmethyltransferase family protein [Candidatus Kapabacteria bacterium]|nr:isoprenylcysteine carboxylmethyltransferase family protein [Candidatus Kapabacteria bacterium]